MPAVLGVLHLPVPGRRRFLLAVFKRTLVTLVFLSCTCLLLMTVFSSGGQQDATTSLRRRLAEHFWRQDAIAVFNNESDVLETSSVDKAEINQKVPRLFVDDQHLITKDETKLKGKNRGIIPPSNLANVINRHNDHGDNNQQKSGQDQQFLQMMVENGADDSDGHENITRLIQGRPVPPQHKPVAQPDNKNLDEVRRRQRFDYFKSVNLSGPGNLPICDEPSPSLIGKLKQSTLLMTSLKESEVLHTHSDLKTGGCWRPLICIPRYKVAIIVPFRDRQSHLVRLIDYLVPVLKRQLLDFCFVVTEQYGRDLFNKGRIMNAAFRFAHEKLHVDCVIFHDVDMFPNDDRNFYGCPTEPRHIGAFVNTLGYELWYNYIVGGVLAIQVDQYIVINGYSNMFWAWGGEDDDMGLRILANNFTIERPDAVVGRMTMLKHIKRQKIAPSLVGDLLKTSNTRWVKDGLNYTQWSVVKMVAKPLYYHLYVDVGTSPEEWKHNKAKSKKK